MLMLIFKIISIAILMGIAVVMFVESYKTINKVMIVLQIVF